MAASALLGAAGLAAGATTTFVFEGGKVETVTPVFKFVDEDTATAAANLTVVNFDEEFEKAWCGECKVPEEELGSLAGKALFRGEYSESCFNCGYAKLATMAKDAGAGALLWFSHEVAGHEAYVIHSMDDFEQADETFLAVEVSGGDCAKVLQALEQGEVQVDAFAGSNVWDDFHATTWLYVRIFLWVANGLVSVLAITRLSQFAMTTLKTGQYKTPVFIFLMELLCTALRCGYLVDPMWAYGIFTYAPSRILLSITIPLELISTVALTLAWNDMMQLAYAKKRSFLSKKSKMYLMGSAIVLAANDLLFSCLAAFAGLVLLSTIFGAITTLFGIGVSIGILVVGTKLIKMVKKFSSNGSGSSQEVSVTISGSKSSEGSFSENAFNSTSVETDSALGGGGSFASMSPEDAKAVTKPKVGKATRKQARSNLNIMTRKIMVLAGITLLSSITVFISAQEVVLFTPDLRAALFSALFGLLAVQGFLKITFFQVPK